MASKFLAFNFPCTKSRRQVFNRVFATLHRWPSTNGKRKRSGPRSVTFIVPRQSRYRRAELIIGAIVCYAGVWE